jgi:hypothetical protein
MNPQEPETTDADFHLCVICCVGTRISKYRCVDCLSATHRPFPIPFPCLFYGIESKALLVATSRGLPQ